MNKIIIFLFCLYLSLQEYFHRKPLVDDLYTADPSAHVFNGAIYIYPSHDTTEDPVIEEDTDQYGMRDYHVYRMTSTEEKPEDLGVAFTLEDIPWALKQLWAPDCVETDGKYFFVFPARDKNKMFRLGIAKSDKPEGPFVPEKNYIEGSYSIDPCMFPDTDGKYYLVFGGIWGGQLDQYRNNKWSPDNHGPVGKEEAISPKIALMKDSLLEFAEEPRDLIIVDENGIPLTAEDENRRFFEGPWLFKKDDLYYFTYSTGTTHFICYATSTNVYGPYIYRGIILTPVLGWTTHHSILEFKGSWYLFYHDDERSKIDHKRNIKFTSLHFNDDGTIEKIEGTNK